MRIVRNFEFKCFSRLVGAGSIGIFAVCQTLGFSAGLALAATEFQVDGGAQQSPLQGIVHGGKVTIANGQAMTWAEVDEKGQPRRLVLALPDAALTLGHEGREFVITAPKVKGLPFDHIGIDWNPQGHAPNGIYNIPHFDVHFYMINQEERASISGDQMVRAGREPKSEFIPKGFISSNEAVPSMGMHWIDPSSPEFNGSPFLSTFIYGFFDGHMNFMEVMFAKSLLLDKSTVDSPISQPLEFEKKGFYPTRWTLRPDEAGHRTLITYEDFREHK